MKPNLQKMPDGVLKTLYFIVELRVKRLVEKYKYAPDLDDQVGKTKVNLQMIEDELLRRNLQHKRRSYNFYE